MNTSDPTRPSLGLVNNNSEQSSNGITNIQTIQNFNIIQLHKDPDAPSDGAPESREQKLVNEIQTLKNEMKTMQANYDNIQVSFMDVK